MKIFLTDQAGNFVNLLKELEAEPVMTFDKSKLNEKTTILYLRRSAIAFFCSR
jgi:hypothetical protein